MRIISHSEISHSGRFARKWIQESPQLTREASQYAFGSPAVTYL